MNVVRQFESTAYLSPKHKSHIESRGLLNDWSFANCRTASADEASVYLGYAAKSGGILFAGATPQFQFRLDKPWKSEGSKRAPKYRTPVGGDTKWQFRILLVTLKTYWTKKHGFLVFCGL
jgi:putative DNA primase/helicase